MPTIEQLQRLLAADPGDAFTLYALAQEHAKRGDVAKAVEHYDRCLTSDPTYVYAYYHKARVLAGAGQSAAARAAVQAGIDAATKLGDAKALNELRALALDMDD
jgi:tetratricopeptide (TPR) repeat protein